MEEETIKIIIRTRPLNIREKKNNEINCITYKNETKEIIIKINEKEAQIFRCDSFISSNIIQEEFFNLCGIINLLDSVLNGYRSCIFAYGQTGSGKTHTMIGSDDLLLENNNNNNSISNNIGSNDNTGIIWRSLNYLYNRLQEYNGEYIVRISCLELYQEHLYDLFVDERDRVSLPIREHPKTGFFVEGCQTIACENLSQACKLIQKALKYRQIGSHDMNHRSSRSHFITDIFVELPGQSLQNTNNINGNTFEFDDNREYTIMGKVSFVDLAGSERLKNTNSTGRALIETGSINSSLYVLGKVIAAISKNVVSEKKKEIPYRDSKLTKLLINSLGGTSKTMMITCISESNAVVQETLRTLRFTMAAARIKNRPVRFLDPQEKLILELKEEIKRLRLENQKLRVGMSTASESSSSRNYTSQNNNNTIGIDAGGEDNYEDIGNESKIAMSYDTNINNSNNNNNHHQNNNIINSREKEVRLTNSRNSIPKENESYREISSSRNSKGRSSSLSSSRRSTERKSLPSNSNINSNINININTNIKHESNQKIGESVSRKNKINDNNNHNEIISKNNVVRSADNYSEETDDDENNSNNKLRISVSASSAIENKYLPILQQRRYQQQIQKTTKKKKKKTTKPVDDVITTTNNNNHNNNNNNNNNSLPIVQSDQSLSINYNHNHNHHNTKDNLISNELLDVTPLEISPPSQSINFPPINSSKSPPPLQLSNQQQSIKLSQAKKKNVPSDEFVIRIINPNNNNNNKNQNQKVNPYIAHLQQPSQQPKKSKPGLQKDWNDNVILSTPTPSLHKDEILPPSPRKRKERERIAVPIPIILSPRTEKMMQKSGKTSTKNQKLQNQLNSKSPQRKSSKPLTQSISTPSFSNQQSHSLQSQEDYSISFNLSKNENNTKDKKNIESFQKGSTLSLEEKLQLLETELSSKREIFKRNSLDLINNGTKGENWVDYSELESLEQQIQDLKVELQFSTTATSTSSLSKTKTLTTTTSSSSTSSSSEKLQSVKSNSHDSTSDSLTYTLTKSRNFIDGLNTTDLQRSQHTPITINYQDEHLQTLYGEKILDNINNNDKSDNINNNNVSVNESDSKSKNEKIVQNITSYDTNQKVSNEFQNHNISTEESKVRSVSRHSRKGLRSRVATAQKQDQRSSLNSRNESENEDEDYYDDFDEEDVE